MAASTSRATVAVASGLSKRLRPTTCAPVTEAIRSYPVKIEGGRVFLAVG